MITHKSLLYFGRHQIYQREDEHPDQIDEMPVKTANLDILVLEFAAPDSKRDNAEVDHADHHVRHVQSGEGEESAAEKRYAPFITGRRDMLVVDQVQPFRQVQP